jgi:hypothetical protein
VHLGELHLQPQVRGLLLEQRTEGVAGNSLGKAWVVLDVLTVEYLTTGGETL